MAVSISGNGLSAAALPIIGTLLLEQYGWRGAFFGVAAILATLSLPMIWLFFPKDTVGDQAQSAPAPHGRAIKSSELLDAFRSTVFWRTAITCLTCTIGITGILLHFVPILVESGLDNRTAAVTAGAAGIAVIIGRLTTGILLDHIHARWVGGFAFLLPAVSCLVLLGQPGQGMALVAAVFVGLALGAEIDIIGYAASRYFGLKRFGTIFGVFVGLASLAAGIGPFVGAALYSMTGSYEIVITSLLVLFIISSLMMLSLPRYPAEVD